MDGRATGESSTTIGEGVGRLVTDTDQTSAKRARTLE